MHTPVWQRLTLLTLLTAVGSISRAEPPAASSADAARRSQVVASYDTAAGSGTGKITGPLGFILLLAVPIEAPP